MLRQFIVQTFSIIGTSAMTPDTFSGLSPKLQQIADQAYLLGAKLLAPTHRSTFLLADICLQFWEWPAYRHLEGQFPVTAAARVEAVTVLFKANGPLTQY